MVLRASRHPCGRSHSVVCVGLCVGLCLLWAVATAWPQEPSKTRAARQRSRSNVIPRVRAQLEINSPPLSPAAQQRLFHVPEGFEVELVLAESEGLGKFVGLAFDARGRLWTMTALEYPVDANDDPKASAALFARGGRDKVLVIDGLYDGRPRVRVFVNGLAIPLGILPYRGGVIVQYGPEIRYYRDQDGDGQADSYETILKGFGTQDSHLFPHQFTRVPGGWVLMAQGLFNQSVVRRGDGRPFASGASAVVFKHCKLARFRPDGTDFELLTAGPNNIWGLTRSREGEIWIQEANDLGYPIIPFEPGGRYPTPSPDRLKAYQPLMPPPLAPPQMGGTGLSGLALADDRDGWPWPWGRRGAEPDAPLRFYVANPVMGRIQMIEATRQSNGRYRYRKLPDFLTCEDPRFRPVALQFGPDGCLYIVDWYNKIISHNEVPRNHPERDRTRGRIWRVRHVDQPRREPPDLTTLSDEALVGLLGADNARVADLVWQEIVDRDARHLVPRLLRIAQDRRTPADRRLGALWALEGLDTVPASLLARLAEDPNPNLRYEAIRIAGAQPRPEEEFLAVAERVLDDPVPRVRAALGDALRRVELSSPRGLRLLFRYVEPPLEEGSEWERYDRAFERFLARWAMERHASAIRPYLFGAEGRRLPLESRLLAVLALPGPEAAVALARMIPEIDRTLRDEEVRILAAHMTQPAVAAVLEQALSDRSTRQGTLRALLRLRTELDLRALRPSIAEAVIDLWNMRDASARRLAVQAAGAFRLRALEAPLATLAARPAEERALRLMALRALRELGIRKPELLEPLLEREGADRELQQAALLALAESELPAAVALAADRLGQVPGPWRRQIVERLATTRAGATALLRALDRGLIVPVDLPVAVLDRMRLLLPNDNRVKELWEAVADRVQFVLRLRGGPEDCVRTNLTLDGPFTVETWIRLAPGVSNADGILGAPGQLDMNFYQGRFRVWVRGHHDIVIAKRQVRPQSWTHVAVTRDEQGVFRIYINGELDATSKRRERRAFSGLDVGRTIPASVGTEAELAEFRVWGRALSAREIRAQFDVTFRGAARPKELLVCLNGRHWGPLSGQAETVPISDGPALQSVAEARARAEVFAYYRRLAKKPGDVKRGRKLFERHCLVCHTVANRGGRIGPPLDGVGLKGLESLLRNVLTPNAAVESGYRSFRVLTTDGRIIQGLLVSDSPEAVVIRQPDTADVRIPREQIERAGFTGTSVMPEGILESLRPEEARDLLQYLLGLR